MMLVVIEGFMIVLALICSVYIRFWNDFSEIRTVVRFPDFLLQMTMVVLTLQVCFYQCRLYDQQVFGRPSRHVVSLLQSLGAGCMVLGVAYFLFPPLLIGRGVFFITIVLVGVFVFGSRLVFDRAWDNSPVRENVLILGTQRTARAVANEIRSHEDSGVRLVGFVRENGERAGWEYEEDSDLHCGIDELETIAAELRVSRIIVALEDRRGSLPVPELVKLRMNGMEIEDAHTALTALTGRVWLNLVQPSWFIFSSGFRRSSLTLLVKRTLDIVCAGIGLIGGSPLMLLVAAAIRLDSKGPILFRQVRVGRNGESFELWKFRSMRIDAEQQGAQWAEENDPRVTRIGKWLRKFRLDELPQFINVLRGDMSFVGPRPERPVFVDQLKLQIPYYGERHFVRPGITGWAQVQYCYGASIADTIRKLEYDLYYLKHMSVFFDLLIILKTIGVVVNGRHGR